MIVLKITEEFRCETEAEANQLIEQIKEKGANSGYEVTAWNVTKKEKKSKGEVIDSAAHVKIVKKFNEFWTI